MTYESSSKMFLSEITSSFKLQNAITNDKISKANKIFGLIRGNSAYFDDVTRLHVHRAVYSICKN